MKKNKLIIGLFAFVTLGFASCIKDNGFDNNEYGIKDPQGEAKGVSFALARNPKNAAGLDALSTTPQILKDLVVVNLDNGSVPDKDVNVTFVVDNSIIARYNAANKLTGTDSINVLRPVFYTLPSFTVKVPAGSRLGQVAITIPKTVGLSLDSSYAIGLRIVSNDGGYTIAENLKNLLLVFSLKNQYDGVYKCEWTNYHPSLNPGYTGSTIEVEMRTSGPKSVKIWFQGIFAAPAILSGGLNAFGSQEPEYTINSTTNAVTVFNSYVPAAVIYNMNPTWPNNYDPALKIINVKWGYNNPGGIFVPGSTREWTQKLTYLRPR